MPMKATKTIPTAMPAVRRPWRPFPATFTQAAAGA